MNHIVLEIEPALAGLKDLTKNNDK